MLFAKAKGFLMETLPAFLLMPMIVVSGVLAKQAVYKILPAVFSLFIMLLWSKLYRVSFLLGAANCVLYAVGFLAEGLYGSLISTLVVSAPMQIMSWFLWKRKAYKQAALFRRMRARRYPLAAAAAVALWAGMLSGSALVGGANAMIVLDSLLFALGLVSAFLTMLLFLEGFAVNVLCCALSVLMWAILTARDARNITYVLIYCYNTYCAGRGAYTSLKMYRVQQSEQSPCGADERQSG